MEHPTAVPVGEAFEIALTLDQTAYQLAAGHRLRVALSTTYWPFVWPSAEAATVTVLSGGLDIPVHSGAVADEWAAPPAEAAAPWSHRVVQSGQVARRIEQDLFTGKVALVVEDDTGLAENLNLGLITGERLSERWSVHPDDPLSAEAFFDWEQRLARAGVTVRTQGWARMTATQTTLLLTAHLEAWEGQALVFSRDWAQEVPREHV